MGAGGGGASGGGGGGASGGGGAGAAATIGSGLGLLAQAAIDRVASRMIVAAPARLGKELIRFSLRVRIFVLPRRIRAHAP
jgi:hypothetical protein